MHMRIVLSGLLLMFLFAGCHHPGDRLKVDVSAVRVPEVTIHRYDLDLFRANISNLKPALEALRPQYRFFLDTNLNDTVKLMEMKSYLENERNQLLYREVEKKFTDLGTLQSGLTQAFRHCKYYEPDFRVPRVYSYISGCDYMNSIQVADSVMLIALDCFLGKDNTFYVQDALPLYQVVRMDPDYIVPEAMSALCAAAYPSPAPGNTLLEQMVEAGKRVWFTDAMLPDTPGCLKMGYTPGQFEWASKNEQQVWAAIIENNMLYSTSGQVLRTFMADGPFTAEFSKESPPRLGEYIGWRIVSKYMDDDPGISLRELMEERDAQKILTQSRYKPSK
jgi:hypothetical protein